jgi:hypothetical protein
MNSFQVFANGEAARKSGAESRVFDWNKAATLIKQHKPVYAGAGLRDDWEWTGGTIYRDGEPVNKEETYTYLASNWAIPELKLTFEDGRMLVLECWVWDNDVDNPEKWDECSYWTKSALDILNA